MQKSLIRKGIIVGIVILFFGASVVSAINSNGENTSVESVNVINEIENLNRGTETFYPTDDAYIGNGIPNVNTGDSAYLPVRNRYGSTSDLWAAHPLIKFDITSIPENITVITASLYLYYFLWEENNPVGRPLTVYRLTSNWDEDTVTWNTQPPAATNVSASKDVPPSASVWMFWDVTEDVQDFINGAKPNYGWKIMDETYWGMSNIPRTTFYSKEYGSNIPFLEIEVLEPHMAFLFGRIENLDTEGDITTFDAVKLRYLQFSPFSFNTYVSGEKIAVVGLKMGILTTNFAFGFFNAALL